jgi:MarR family transcriptional regulator, lower aerobic nicotinate degradation pathway regulator
MVANERGLPVAGKRKSEEHDAIGVWMKRCYFAGRAVMDAALRPHDLGSTQWYVLHRLATEGPTIQRDLVKFLEIERATLSGIVATLLRKDLVEQAPDPADQRRKLLRLTPAGEKLWDELPDLSFVRKTAFGWVGDADRATTIRVLQAATERLDKLLSKGVGT